MKRTTLILLIFVPLITGSLTGCERTIQLDLDQVPGRIVIEGLLTDVPDRQYVRVTRSGGFYQQGSTIRITNAMVQITDDQGEQVSFQHNPRNYPDSIGYYLPPAGYAGKADRTYSLSVQVDGKSYEATDKLLRVTKIDTLTYRPNVFAQRDPPSDGKLYELLIYAKEPQDTKDYYFIQYYRNDSLTFNGETEVYFADDYGIGEDINGIPSNIRFAVGDKGRVEMYSLSRNGFLYYSDLVTILNSDGGMFSPPPANPRSNITGGALGFFQVSAMSSKETIIQE